MHIARFHRLMAPEAGGDAGAAGAGAAAAGATGAPGGTPGAGSADPAALGAGGDPSLLQAGAAGAGAADPLAYLLTEHRVMAADGKVDEAASARKQAESYKALATRMRETGAPPKTADEYQIAVPDALKDVYDPSKDKMLGDFRSKALELGLTQKQFQAVMEDYMGRLPMIAEGLFEASYEKGEQSLKQHWKSDDQMKSGLRDAATAVKGFDPAAFGEDGTIASAELKSLMNNPYFLRMAAHFGAQMQEDGSPGNPAGQLPAGSAYRGMTLAQLESNEAYTNPRHPDYAIVSQMVQHAYHKQTGEALPA